MYKLCPVCKRVGKPLMNSATDSDASQTIHEELMGYGIKGGTEVKVESRPGSAAWRRSLVILTRAVSVLCFGAKSRLE